MSALLHLTNVGVSLARRRVVHGISLHADAGEFIALVGPNGAGKTSLLRAIAGLLPCQGEILLGTDILQELEAVDRARHIAFMPQNGTLAWPMPVRDVVAIGRLPHEGTNKARDDGAIINKAIADCGLSALADQNADHLSGGERVRVLLARSLAVNAPILLLDEPVASLDPAWQLQVMDLLAAQAKAGRIIVCVLHDLALAMRYATRMIVMRDGRLQADGRPRELLSDLQKAFDLDFELIETPTGPTLHAHRK
jgi:iron complex transport system ATP-binding protein